MSCHDSPDTASASERASAFGLDRQGLTATGLVHWNLSFPALVEEAVARREGTLTLDGPFAVHPGSPTATSPEDTFVVREPTHEGRIAWGEQNRPFPLDGYTTLRCRLAAHWQGRPLFVQEVYAGAGGDISLPVRIVSDRAWVAAHARSMYRTPQTADEYRSFVPEYTLLVSPSFRAEPNVDGTRSDVAVVHCLLERTSLICGTGCTTEIARAVTTAAAFLLAEEGAIALEASAAVGPDLGVALFLGAPGAGRTTLACEGRGRIFADGSLCWAGDGVFALQTGCNARMAGAYAGIAPRTRAAASRFGTLLENTLVDPLTRAAGSPGGAGAAAARAAFPISAVENAVTAGRSDRQPRHLVITVADALGVLPALARLTPEQAMYQLLSGYCPRMPGVGGPAEPEPSFAPCFGAPFPYPHPCDAILRLLARIEAARTSCWLVNTGFVGGPWGSGTPLSPSATQALVDAALSGALDGVAHREDPLFGFRIPTSCPGAPADRLAPGAGWTSAEAEARARAILRFRFARNFAPYVGVCPDRIAAGGPRWEAG